MQTTQKRVFYKGQLRKIFGIKTEEETGDWRYLHVK
jgi:hypothetical protein